MPMAYLVQGFNRAKSQIKVRYLLSYSLKFDIRSNPSIDLKSHHIAEGGGRWCLEVLFFDHFTKGNSHLAKTSEIGPPTGGRGKEDRFLGFLT
jgi:hypothetical protein